MVEKRKLSYVSDVFNFKNGGTEELFKHLLYFLCGKMLKVEYLSVRCNKIQGQNKINRTPTIPADSTGPQKAIVCQESLVAIHLTDKRKGQGLVRRGFLTTPSLAFG